MRITKLPGLGEIPFEFVLVLAQAFLLVNAGLFIKTESITSYRTLIMVYMLLLVTMKVFAGRGIFEPVGLGRGLMWFAIGLTATSVVLGGGDFLMDFQTFQYSTDANVILLITQTLIVASSEEMIFRNYLPAEIGVLPATAAFALFHAYAYGLALPALLVAFLAGLVFYFAAKYTSLWTSVGMHAAWNLWSLGVLTMVVV